jgi:hypothetical protein
VRKLSRDRIDPARRRAILEALKPELAALAPSRPDFDPMKAVFKDPREGGSMRLTKIGFDLLSEKYPHWSEQLPAMMTVANHTYLVAVSTFPYYMSDDVLTTFDPNLGVLMKMVSGDFVKLERLLPRN